MNISYCRYHYSRTNQQFALDRVRTLFFKSKEGGGGGAQYSWQDFTSCLIRAMCCCSYGGIWSHTTSYTKSRQAMYEDKLREQYSIKYASMLTNEFSMIRENFVSRIPQRDPVKTPCHNLLFRRHLTLGIFVTSCHTAEWHSLMRVTT